MAYLLPQPPPLLHPRVFHWHLGIDGESTAIPAPKSFPLIFNQLIINVKAIAGRAEEGTDTTTYTLGGYFLPVVLIVKASQQLLPKVIAAHHS